jgi:preprotein translocase subunit SecF
MERQHDFMKTRMIAAVFSGILFLGSLVSLAVNGLNLGLDYTGGTLVEVGFGESVQLADVRSALAAGGWERSQVSHLGSDAVVIIRIPGADSAKIGEQIVGKLHESFSGDITLRRSEFVGPQMGEELLNQGVLAVLLALGGVWLYVSLRFQWKLSVGAVVALVHDPVLVIGAFSLFQWEVDLTVLAAVLALIGYSINDTVVVYDRLRENFRKMRRMDRLAVCNASLNQTLGRTIMTSGVTLLAVLGLLFFGGEVLRGFSTALTIGIIIGTYSSIYIATSFALWLGLDRADLMLPAPEKAEGQEGP